MTRKHLLLLGLILIIGAALRLFNLTGFSLSNDELSALGRLEFKNVYEVIEQGIRPDGHPAGVQLFLYYWTMIFGNSEFAVRLPFALFGIGSIALLFFVARIWFGTNTAIYSSLALAVLQYPILFSQIARPYSPGLFFVLAFAFFWSALFFHSDSYKNKKYGYFAIYSAFIISALGCLYTHYIAALCCLIIYLSGVLFINKQTAFTYLVLGLLILVGFLPHTSIFLHQLQVGGVGGDIGWLDSPSRGFLGKFIFYAFNGSDIIYLFVILICVGAFVYFRKRLELTKFHALSISWFLIVYFITFYYSIFRNPILQYSILLFAFPFLLMFVFSFLPKEVFHKKNLALLGLFALALLFSTIIEKKYYTKQHFGEFRQLAEKTIEYSNKFGSENIARAINIHSPFYIDYYMEELNTPLDFKIYKTVDPEHMRQLATIVELSNEPHFLQAWSTINNSALIEQIITSKYPVVIARDTFFNSGLVLYSKSNELLFDLKEPLFTKLYDYDSGNNPTGEYELNTLISHSGSACAEMDSVTEFGPVFRTEWKKVTKEKDVFVQSEVYAMVEDTAGLKANLVFSIELNGKSVMWRSTEFKTFISEPNKWSKVFLSYPVPNTLQGNEEVKVYIWKPGLHKLYTDDLKISFTQR